MNTGNPNYIHYVTSKGRADRDDAGVTTKPGLTVFTQIFQSSSSRAIAQQRSIKRTQVENDLVGTVLFLSSSESDFMSGQLLHVDGGYHFVG